MNVDLLLDLTSLETTYFLILLINSIYLNSLPSVWAILDDNCGGGHTMDLLHSTLDLLGCEEQVRQSINVHVWQPFERLDWHHQNICRKGRMNIKLFK